MTAQIAAARSATSPVMREAMIDICYPFEPVVCALHERVSQDYERRTGRTIFDPPLDKLDVC